MSLVLAGISVMALFLTVSAVLPTGNGALHWAPAGRPLVSWDLDVEID